MTTVSIWTFDTPAGAEVALRTLERLQNRRRLVIDDAAVVVWPADVRRPRTYQAGTAMGTAALSGAFWGLLFGLVFLLPLAGTPDGATGLARVGLSDELLAQLRDRIAAGTSALFLLSGGAVLDDVREALAGLHTDLLVTTLDHTQDKALYSAFATDDITETTGAHR
ncbi:DUF1269 domain-containing protein [Pseudonocardia sp. N23]|uniref:DUF1269 domain-containing protein n=1 Tax=Pseudonocardia sp. N23 TaxID=1987376 RepID=UPI000BFD60E7|nr:DUF1269 domain-containing protein [Pseudonocardia sp. N23]GAY12952.1 hypothetical protein TOK_1505 [Pseudonocardia sp. N23]